MKFFAESLQVFKKVFIPLFALVVLSTNIDQYLNLYIENALQDPMGAQGQVYFFGFLSLLSSVIFPTLLIAFALYALNLQIGWTQSLGSFLKKNLNQLYIETLRSWGKTLLWTLLFVIPGIIKYLQYVMVPIVVTSSSRYEDGKEDALEASAKIVRHNWGKILLIFFVFQILAPLLLASVFNSYRLLWKTPAQSLALSALDTYLILFSTHLLFTIFRNEVRKHDAHV